MRNQGCSTTLGILGAVGFLGFLFLFEVVVDWAARSTPIFWCVILLLGYIIYRLVK